MSARALSPLLSIRVTPGRSTTNSRSGCEWRASSQWKPRSAIIADMLSQGAHPEEILARGLPSSDRDKVELAPLYIPEAEEPQVQALNRFLHRGRAALVSASGEKVEFP